MRIAIIADARSEHTRRWVSYFSSRDDVLLLSTHPFSGSISGVKSLSLPKLFSAGGAIARSTQGSSGRRSLPARLISQALLKAPIFWHVWQRLNIIDVLVQGRAARREIQAFKPDLVHAMRIQNEGYVGVLARLHPLILSVMGNDLVYIARESFLHRILTRRTVARCDGITADCFRDLRLADKFGLPRSAASEYFPSNGGVDLTVFAQGIPQNQRKRELLYFRGISPLYRPITLFKAVSIIARRKEYSDVILRVLAPPASIPWFEEKRAAHGVPAENFSIGSFLPAEGLAQLLQTTAIVVSPTISDGTPNSMLEAMACGAFPVMSDLESNREWIKDGENGLIFDPENAAELAAKLMLALDNITLREKAQSANYAIVNERVDYSKVMPAIRQFYQRMVGS